MAQNYASSTLGIIDERFYTESKTASIVNKSDVRIEFNGKNSVTIYSVDTVTENDYVRTGTNRFGQLNELGTSTQTFVLSQDKAFTFSVDRGSLEDSMMAQEVDKAVDRQIREVSIPTVDTYTLAILAAKAVANSQSATSSLSSSDIYSKMLTQVAALIDAEVPQTDLVLFLSATSWNLVKRDPEFMRACDITQKNLITGKVGEVDGMEIIVCPSTYYVANFGFMIVHKSVVVRPVKFDMVRILDDVQGIDGKVVEGRRYYDAFIPTNKAEAIRLHKIA